METICVFLGANFGSKDIYKNETIKLGKEIASRNLTLVYGGSGLGMMGLLANTVKEHGSKVIGVISKHLIDKETPLTTLDDLHIVGTMQERKSMMKQMADIFVVMPGGLGTLEEAFDVWNAIKIGELKKKMGFLNIDGYFDSLFTFVEHCQKNEFVSSTQKSIPYVDSNIKLLVDKLIKSDEKSLCFN